MKLDIHSPAICATIECNNEYIDACFKSAYLMTGTTKEVLLSPLRDTTTVWLRLCIAHKLKDRIPQATHIAALLNRDHATCLHWQKKFEDLMCTDAFFNRFYNRFETIFSQQ